MTVFIHDDIFLFYLIRPRFFICCDRTTNHLASFERFRSAILKDPVAMPPASLERAKKAAMDEYLAMHEKTRKDSNGAAGPKDAAGLGAGNIVPEAPSCAHEKAGA